MPGDGCKARIRGGCKGTACPGEKASQLNALRAARLASEKAMLRAEFSRPSKIILAHKRGARASTRRRLIGRRFCCSCLAANCAC